jgi:hypothetical protein
VICQTMAMVRASKAGVESTSLFSSHQFYCSATQGFSAEFVELQIDGCLSE